MWVLVFKVLTTATGKLRVNGRGPFTCWWLSLPATVKVYLRDGSAEMDLPAKC